MPELVINCQNLSCPEPVLRCRQALLEGAQSLVVIVDTPAARENVSRFLGSQGFGVQAEENGRITSLRAERNVPAQTASAQKMADSSARKILVLLTSSKIGTGDDALGEKLMGNFLSTLSEMGQELWKILCLNSAVHLTTAGNPALPHLQKIAETGAQILVCGTCLTHYGLMDKKAVGETTNMLDVVTAMQAADSVIHP